MATKNSSARGIRNERTWTFEIGDRVPEWLMRQTNCVLRFHRDTIVVESEGRFQLYPTYPMRTDETLILAEILNTGKDSSVEHVLPITTHVSPRKGSLN